MGNILCKNRTNKTAPARTKSPVDRVIRNLQICPQGIGKKKYFWEKQILETSAPSQIPKDNKNGWQDATLAVPFNEKNINELERPIPPPRKKRSNKLHKNDYDDHEHIKNGFEDLFLGDKENVKSKSLSNINTNNNQNEQPKSQTTNSLSKLNIINNNNNDTIEINNKVIATTLPRKISKVGNKKSDKFFGENISDCLSDEIITQSKDNNDDNNKMITIENITIETTENKNETSDKDLKIVNLNDENEINIDVSVVEEEELLRKINKEKGKLMFSIERQIDKTKNKNNDEERYKGEIPVEEEIIVPVKKINKHICDDDHEIHLHIHKHNNISPNPSSSGPKKPQRDLAKYRKSLNKKDIIESSQIGNESITYENLNHSKCDHETQTGKGGEINKHNHTIPIEIMNNNTIQQTNNDIDKEKHKVPSEIIDNVTHQAKLAINDILKTAEAAVEQQLSNEILKTSTNNKEEKETVEKMEELLASMILSNDLITHTNINDSNDIKIPLQSEKTLKIVSTDLISPEIKIDQTVIINQNENPKTEIIDITKTESSIRPTRSSEIIPPNLSNSEKIFRRCLSTQSYLTSDLIEKIALQANILSLPGGFSPEDALQCNDGSGLVSPNFKLEQKRSLSPQISIISDKNDNEIKQITKMISNENVNNINEIEKSTTDKNDDGIKVLENNKNNNLKSCEKDIVVDIKTEILNNIRESTTPPLNKISQNKVGKRVIRTPNRILNNDNSLNLDNDSKRDVSDAIKTFLNQKDLKPDKILDLLQDEFGDCIFSQCLPIEDKLIIDDLQKSIKETSQINIISTPTSTPTEIKSSFKFTDKKSINKLPTEKHKISKIPVLTTNKYIDNNNIINFNDKRRHSIDDLNAWFTPEKDFPLRKRKREGSLPGSLDNPELYNGKSIHNSYFPRKSILIEQENEENIEKSANILVDDILSNAENNVNGRENQNKQNLLEKEEKLYSNGTNNNNNESITTNINGNTKKHQINQNKNNNNNNNESDEDDHSALLKFLEHEKLNN